MHLFIFGSYVHETGLNQRKFRKYIKYHYVWEQITFVEGNKCFYVSLNGLFDMFTIFGSHSTQKKYEYFKECMMALNEMKINCESQSESIKAARKLTQWKKLS